VCRRSSRRAAAQMDRGRVVEAARVHLPPLPERRGGAAPEAAGGAHGEVVLSSSSRSRRSRNSWVAAWRW
jgi:hypothetical protein